MRRRLVLGIALGAILALHPLFAADAKKKAVLKAGLQKLNPFIGDFKGPGGPDKPRFDPREGWSEKVVWSWKFKGDDCWLTLKFFDSKLYKEGEIRYLPESEKYKMILTDLKGNKLEFVGELDEDYLTFLHTAPNGDVVRIQMNMAGEGARFIYRQARKQAKRTIFRKEYLVALTRLGESFASGKKKPECVVTGGVGTSTVTYKGKTYYVCCSGCRDAFNENPEQIIKEYLERKKKGR
ncbi:MAG: hypothetical protein KatS3mg105_1689 [Gemmatales bacterium]|nr:MAG: hypothetical protein KatS3mg105_1689 [Gemmatales bacterium]